MLERKKPGGMSGDKSSERRYGGCLSTPQLTKAELPDLTNSPDAVSDVPRQQ
jgi:hypothetical protein